VGFGCDVHSLIGKIYIEPLQESYSDVLLVQPRW